MDLLHFASFSQPIHRQIEKKVATNYNKAVRKDQTQTQRIQTLPYHLHHPLCAITKIKSPNHLLLSHTPPN